MRSHFDEQLAQLSRELTEMGVWRHWMPRSTRRSAILRVYV